MNKNVIIAALVALLIGIGIGFGMNQMARGSAELPAETTTASAGEQDSRATSQAESLNVAEEELSSAQPAEKIENLSSVGSSSLESSRDEVPVSSSIGVVEDGTYTSKDEVAAYIHEFGHLPSNYISKTKARNAGWVSKEGNLDEVLPGMSIGGSEFYNDEGQLPDAPGRTWTECDINYTGGYRGAERIVFSNDGLIFYTADHYETFEQLY